MVAGNLRVMAVALVALVAVGVIASAPHNLPKRLEDSWNGEGLNYTDEELQEIYEKYDVSEEELRFARDGMPHYLNDTILGNGTRVIATDDGRPPEDMEEGRDYDVVISTEEMRQIIEDARERYREKYGVDPGETRIDVVQGYPLPEEEVRKLVTWRIIQPTE